jgi:hypothetical protein
LNGHMHLVSQNKSKELLFLCFFNWYIGSYYVIIF